MSNLAIYRKYRPLTFDEILGQEAIVKVLKESTKRGKFAHAYLFAGPRGTGKTTIARLIAKTANCEAATTKPCNKCSTCLNTDDGRNLDVIEIDAASNRGIDEIRSLKENIRLSPTAGHFKVFIIDEAHMLTKEAFNALLKTLEEPPSYIILILATTEIEKIPPTIISRTQQFYFKRVTLNQIINKLKWIIKKEKIKITNEALDLIAASAEGSFRDAESLLDQLINFDDKNITLQEVEQMIGKIGFDKLSKFSENLLKGKIDLVLQDLSIIEDGGYNLVQFNKDLIHYLRRIAVLKFSPEMKKQFQEEFIPEHLEILISQATLFNDQHLELLKMLIKAYGQMRYSQFPIIPLEIAIIESLK